MNLRISKTIKITLALLLALVGGFLAYHVRSVQQIVDYNPERDRAFIL
jgi:hypothetical protein